MGDDYPKMKDVLLIIIYLFIILVKIDKNLNNKKIFLHILIDYNLNLYKNLIKI